MFVPDRFSQTPRSGSDVNWQEQAAHSMKENLYSFNSSAPKKTCEPIKRPQNDEEAEFHNLMELKNEMLAKHSKHRGESINTFGKAARFPQVKLEPVAPELPPAIQNTAKSPFCAARHAADSEHALVMLAKANNPPSIRPFRNEVEIDSLSCLSFEHAEMKKIASVDSKKGKRPVFKKLIDCLPLKPAAKFSPKTLPSKSKSVSKPSLSKKQHCFTKSNEFKLKVLSEAGVPGPGQYNVKSENFRSRVPQKKFQIFGSGQMRFSENNSNVVGPADYDPYKYVKVKAPFKFSFPKADAERTSNHQETGPGPGSYNPALSSQKRFKRYSNTASPPPRKMPKRASLIGDAQVSRQILVKETTFRIHRMDKKLPFKNLLNHIQTTPSIKNTFYVPKNLSTLPKKQASPSMNFTTFRLSINPKPSLQPLPFPVEQATCKVSVKQVDKPDDKNLGRGFNSSSERFSSKIALGCNKLQIPYRDGFKSFNVS
jgi:hypothetical protein